LETLDKQLEYSPEKTVFCSKCVVSNQRPRITFDENSVCSACNYAETKKNSIDWKERESFLKDLLNKHRSNDGSYDVIVPGSGGKDSSFVAHQLKHKYGMHPLTITWAPFIYTDIGFENYVDFKDSGFDNLLFFPNGKIHRKLSRLGFEFVGDNFLPFIYGQKSYAYHLSLKFKIPLMFYGENGEVEYGGDTRNMNSFVGDPVEDWTKLHHKGVDFNDLVEKGLEKGILKKEDVKDNAFEFYKNPDPEKVKDNGSEMHWFSNYKKWIPQENYYYAVENTGFKANKGRSEGTYSKYASLDDRLDGFHYYMSYIKFGIGRATSDAAHEIRDGHLTREEGVALVKRYDGEFPKKHFDEFLEYIDISEEYFWEIVNNFRSKRSNIWKNINGKWEIRHTVNHDGVDD
jgi:N-acetyl sugar amidotransferase